jgi:hypothetical protein
VPPPASAKAVRPSAPSNPAHSETAAPKAAPKPAATAKSKPASKPVAKAKPAPAPARREPEPDAYENDALAAPTPFPDVRVESIRWHPLAERRAASLRFEQQNAADAHEGDIIGGVLVYRIEPGAVELKVGSTSRVVRPGP